MMLGQNIRNINLFEKELDCARNAMLIGSTSALFFKLCGASDLMTFVFPVFFAPCTFSPLAKWAGLLPSCTLTEKQCETILIIMGAGLNAGSVYATGGSPFVVSAAIAVAEYLMVNLGKKFVNHFFTTSEQENYLERFKNSR